MKLVKTAAVVSALAGLTAAGIIFANANANANANAGAARPPAARAASDVASVILEYGRALDADSAADVRNVYADDAVLAPPAQPVKRGAAEVSKFYEDLFAVADVQITFTIEDVRVHGDLAYVTSHSNGVLKFKDGSPDAGGVGRELFVLRNTNRTWKIVAYWFNN
jgi:uncharacterized protein (TIGR02246 family)